MSFLNLILIHESTYCNCECVRGDSWGVRAEGWGGEVRPDAYWRMLMHAHAYWCMLMHTGACWCMLMHADADWCMHADACWLILVHNICGRCLSRTSSSNKLYWFHILYFWIISTDCMQTLCWCILMHADSWSCILMHTDACTLMHADEYLCVRCVDDVFLEPHIRILDIDFIYMVYNQILHIKLW